DAKRRPKVPMRLWRERKLARRAVPPHLDVAVGALPYRHALVRKIRDRQEPAVAALFDRFLLDAELLDLRCALAIRLLNGRGVQPLTLGACHFVGRGVLLAFKSLEFGQETAPPRFERRKLLELGAEVDAASREAGTNGVK